MKEWKTETWLYHTEGHLKTGKVAVKQGIIQDDSLPLLLFCLAFIPLTEMLNKEEAEYEIKEKYKDSHLFIYLFYFHISHLGTYHGNGKHHIQYTSSGNLQMV